MRSSASTAVVALVALLALAGCGRYVSTPLPDLDPRLVADCNSYPAQPGQDARVIAKAKNKFGRCEQAKKHAIVKTYRELQAARH